MKRLYRSKVDRRLFGVCGGLGEMFNLDPTFFRIAWVMVAFATGFVPAIVAYLVAWVLVPKKKPLESS
jgi:phage shock protein C